MKKKLCEEITNALQQLEENCGQVLLWPSITYCVQVLLSSGDCLPVLVSSCCVATLRPAAVSRACEYVGSKATSSTNVLYDVSLSSS